MTTLWIDCKYGIAGDMLLSALIDVGADEQYIQDQLRQLEIDPFKMTITRKNVHGIQANYLNLTFEEHHHDHSHTHHQEHAHHDHSHMHHQEHAHHDHSHTHHHGHAHHDYSHTHHHEHAHFHRSAADIFKLIESSNLSSNVKAKSIALFKEIARAEGKVHGVPAETVHFHEVGAMDSIIDIIGVCIALDYLKVERIVATPVPTGSGMLKMAHGLYPIPAPATSEILVGVPLSDFDCVGELTTPTGAAFLKVLVDEFVAKPTGTIEKIGYGAGAKEFSHPNVLRVMTLKK